MKFTVERDALAEAVAWVARALPARPVIPVLAGMALRAEGDGLTLSCFDYEVSARMRIPGEVAEPGTVLIPGRLLAEITRSLPGLPVSVADDPDGVSMSCGEASFTVAALPSGDYPALPSLPQLAGTVDGGALAVAIAQVTPAASRDDTLPMLTAVNLELGAGTMTLAATDRYRLAVRELAWYRAPRIAAASDGAVTRAGGAPAPDPESVLVPARTLADAARMMSPGTAVRIMLRDGSGDAGRPGAVAAVGGADGNGAMIGFEAGGRRLTTRLLAGEFIRYRSRFPDEFGCVADLPAAAFAEAVRRVSLVAERGTPVELSFSPDRVSIGAGTLGQARARETVPASFTGGEPVIAFNPHYLLDGVIAATATASAAGTSAGSPAPGRAAGAEAAGEAGAEAAGEAGEAGGAGGAGVARDAGEASSPRVRIGFTSPSKPAVITAGSPAGPEAGNDFRYLVVPQRLAR